jgi:hypothetical protein
MRSNSCEHVISVSVSTRDDLMNKFSKDVARVACCQSACTKAFNLCMLIFMFLLYNTYFEFYVCIVINECAVKPVP